MPRFVARFAEVSGMIARVHQVPDDRSTALRGRLQHLQKLRFPPGVNTGRGRPVEYGAVQIVLLVLALELIVLGVPPERVVTALSEEESRIRPAINLVLAEANKDIESAQAVFLRIQPQALFEGDPNIGFATVEEMAKMLRQTSMLDGFWRHALVNLTGLVDYCSRWAEEVGPADGRSQFLADLAAWNMAEGSD